MGTNVEFRVARTDEELEQILALQAINAEDALDADEVREQGFVTVRHDLELLRDMNDAAPHVVAVADGRVVGYALALLPRFRDRLPILESLFAKLERLEFRGQVIATSRYFVMGQVCVAKDFRGRGVFGGLYAEMERRYSQDYDFIVTEVAERNGRSMRAHEKVGFELVLRYEDQYGTWHLIAWSWPSP